MSDLIDQLMAQVLAEMSVISEQGAQAFGDGTHGGTRDYAPKPLGDKPMMDFYRDCYWHAESYAARKRVLLEACEALTLARRTPITEEPASLADPRWKRWVAETDLPIKEIVRRFPVSRQYVHRIKQQYAGETSVSSTTMSNWIRASEGEAA